MIGDLGAPTRIEGIVVETAEADDSPTRLVEHAPRAETQLSPLALVTGDVTAAGAEIGEPERVAHRVGIAEKRQ